jgi:hypothetical protein
MRKRVIERPKRASLRVDSFVDLRGSRRRLRQQAPSAADGIRDRTHVSFNDWVIASRIGW